MHPPILGYVTPLGARPGKIIGVGVNYRAHAQEMGKPLPEEPLFFFKPSSALIGPKEVLGAVPSRAEARHEPPLDLDGLNRPVHGPEEGNACAEEKRRSCEHP